MDNEIWKSVDGYEGYYEVSNLGHIKSLRRQGGGRDTTKDTILKGTAVETGHLKVRLCVNRKKRSFYVHRLVMHAFHGTCPSDRQVCHNNGIASDNRLSNLRYDTVESNHADRILHGTSRRGSNNWCTKLTENDVRGIRKLISANEMMMKDIAELYNISPRTIISIKYKDVWGWLDAA